MLPSAESSGTGGCRKSHRIDAARRAGVDRCARHSASAWVTSRASSAATAASLARVAATSSVRDLGLSRIVGSRNRTLEARRSQRPAARAISSSRIRGRAARERVRFARVRVGIIPCFRRTPERPLPRRPPVSRRRALVDIADVAGRTNGFRAAAGKRRRTGDQRADTAADDHAADRNGAGGAHEASQRHSRRTVHERSRETGNLPGEKTEDQRRADHLDVGFRRRDAVSEERPPTAVRG